MRGESCDNCGKLLVDVLLEHNAVRLGDVRPVTATLHVYGQCWALSFDIVPAPFVREQLKRGAWRWDGRYRLWWCTTPKPEIPAGVTLPPDREPRPEIFARPPIRHPSRSGQV